MPRDWLTAYREYTIDNEAPEAFHLWSAIATLGHVVNRNVWMDRHYYMLHPGQIMVVLCSESAVSRKSTAMHLATSLLENLDAYHNVITGKSSPAALVDALHRPSIIGVPQRAIGLILADELGSFFNKESHAETLATDVSELNTWPKQWWIRRARTMTVELFEPSLGLLAGTTPTGLAYEIPQVAREAGFFGRLLICYQAEGGKINDLIDKPPDMSRVKFWLMRDLERIARLSGGFVFTEDGKSWFRAWYKDYMTRATAHDNTTGFYARKGDHLLRVAMVLAVSKGDALELSEEVLVRAEQAIYSLELTLGHAQKKVGNAPGIIKRDKVIAFLTHEEGYESTAVKIQMALWRYFDDTTDLRRCLSSLEGSGHVKRVQISRGKKLVPLWRLVFPRGDMLARVQGEDVVSGDDQGRVIAMGPKRLLAAKRERQVQEPVDSYIVTK